MDIYDRGRDGICICCGGELIRKPSLTSEFLSKRAWGGDVEWSKTNKCKVCGFAFHARGLSEQEVSNYYLNYRDEKYFVDRNASEFFYTRGVHDRLEMEMGGEARRASLRHYLTTHGALVNEADPEFSILDFAGGSGRLIQHFSGRKYVYDVSGQSTVPNVTCLSLDQLSNMKFNVVICAQMLEHATDPTHVMNQLFSYVKSDGFLYIEVPYNETWLDFSGDGKIRTILLSLAKRLRWFNILLDTYGTAFRVKLNILPPLAYVPVREHLNYFTTDSFRHLGLKIGGKVNDVSRQQLLGTVLLLQK